jgi:hypothetical protein
VPWELTKPYALCCNGSDRSFILVAAAENLTMALLQGRAGLFFPEGVPRWSSGPNARSQTRTAAGTPGGPNYVLIKAGAAEKDEYR